MIPRIKSVTPLEEYKLLVLFDDGCRKIYDVSDDIDSIPGYQILKTSKGLFNEVKLDSSRTVVFWNDDVDLPSDAIYEYGLSSN